MSDFNTMSDDDLFSLFSDFYKDVNGFRPRGFDRDYAVNWLEFELSPEQQARRRELEDAEEAHWRALELKWEEQERNSREEAEERLLSSREEDYYFIEQRLAV